MRLPRTIAIDGPSGAGKSVLAEALARVLDYRFIDTGVLYRAVTLAALDSGIPTDSPALLGDLAHALTIRIEPARVADGRQYTVLIDDRDVTWAIRDPIVERNVSAVSAVPAVREALVAQQRRLAAEGEVVMVGRDITTVVLPDADLKIYLTASAEHRAQRRQIQLRERDIDRPYADVLAEIQERDRIDSTREASPLTQSDDSIVLDNDSLDVDQTLRAALDIVQSWAS